MQRAETRGVCWVAFRSLLILLHISAWVNKLVSERVNRYSCKQTCQRRKVGGVVRRFDSAYVLLYDVETGAYRRPCALIKTNVVRFYV